jgi:hypothetical protein
MRDGETPARLYRRLALGVGEPAARMAPRRAEVMRDPDRRAEPFVAAGRINCARQRVADDVVKRPVFAIGPAHDPDGAGGVALKNERALLGSDEGKNLLVHGPLPLSRTDSAAKAAAASIVTVGNNH